MAQFTATVVNDPQNKGVTWAVSCSTAPCGTLAPTTTASGVSTTYTAPPTPPESDLPVTITATSVFNTAVTANAFATVPAITVTLTPNSALIPVNVNQTFSATVANDPANKGIAWTLTQSGTPCSPGCGTITPSNTASGVAATYTAPATLPAGPKVTLTATSASDSTKSENATITLTTGTVKLVPANLDFGTRLVGSASSPQTTVLTNTGASSLTINSITITGAGSGAYSLTPTNPCGSSVVSGGSCNISVVFKPGGNSSFKANISISDSSTDSPQLVSLSGNGRVRCRVQIKEALSSAPVRTALATFGTATVPPPTGANIVGTRIMHLVDSRREDPFLENGAKRELMVRFWYPATLNQACVAAEYTPPAVWSYFSQLMGLPLPAVNTNSCLDAPTAEGLHPVVVFTHGYTGTFTDYTFLLEDLASRGYIVASLDHTYEATAVQFPDGRFVHSGFGSHLGNKLLEDEADLTFALSVRLDDLKFIVDELDRLNRSARSPFAGKLDTSRIAVAGHSMGGLAASVAVDREPRFRAGLIIDIHDGYVPDAAVGTTRTPVFILASGREQWTENECKLWNNLHGPRFAVNFAGAEHLTPSDAVWLAKGAVKTGSMGPDKTVTALREYIAAFLDANLRDLPLDPLLTQPSPNYPDVVVDAPGQPLCGKGNELKIAVPGPERR
jgi:predicted dienelactone hydrolase